MDNEIVLRIPLDGAAASSNATSPRVELETSSAATPVHCYTIQRTWRPRTALAPVDFELTEPLPLATGTGQLLRVLGEFKNLAWESAQPLVVQIMACYSVIAECPLVPQGEPGTFMLGCHVSLFGLPMQTQIDLVLPLSGVGPVHLASIALTIQATLPPPTRFSPFFVNGLPRSGTTWLQSLLAAHPEIVVAGGYPFEQSHGIYWTAMARTLTQPDLESHSLRRFWNYSREVPPSPFNPGRNPTPEPWFADKYFQLMGDFSRSVTNAFYENLATAKPWARYFVEKWPGRLVPHVARALYRDVRELYLLRNPRDVVLSILRFNARRGFADFGVEQWGEGEEFIAALARQLREDLLLFRQRTWDKSGIVLDYAELRKDPAGILAATFKLFGMRHSPEVIAEMIRSSAETDMHAHITSDGSADEIRLSQEQEAWIEHYFAGYRDW